MAKMPPFVFGRQWPSQQHDEGDADTDCIDDESMDQGDHDQVLRPLVDRPEDESPAAIPSRANRTPRVKRSEPPIQ